MVGGGIKNFWPKDTDDILWIDATYGISMDYLLDKAREHFGDSFDPEKIKVTAEYIHTKCITYDLYDPSDYTNFISIEMQK